MSDCGRRSTNLYHSKQPCFFNSVAISLGFSSHRSFSDIPSESLQRHNGASSAYPGAHKINFKNFIHCCGVSYFFSQVDPANKGGAVSAAQQEALYNKNLMGMMKVRSER